MTLLTDFANDHAGLWALVALPFAIVPAIDIAAKALIQLRTAVRDEDRNLRLLRKQMRRRIQGEIDERLVLGSLLEAELRPSSGGANITAPGLYGAAEEGAQALVVGGAGSGKSMLGLTLVRHSLEQSAADPASPLMGIVSLRDWRTKGVGRNNWKSLLAWMARGLNNANPTFGAAYFKQLLREQRLIACLDGLDEMSPEARKEAVSALASYAGAGFPLVVFSRDPSIVSSRAEDAGGLVSRFDRFDLLPPSAAALAGVADWPTWKRFIDNARQPHRAAALIGNPLRFGVAALTWNRSERADALARSDDPEAELWGSFFTRWLGDRPDRKDPDSMRQVAGWVAVAAAQRGSSSFRAADLYASSGATGLALAICAAPVLVVAWRQHLLSVGILGVMALAFGLRPALDLRLEGFARKLAPRRGESWEVTLYLGLVILAGAATVVAGNLLESFLRASLYTSSEVVFVTAVFASAFTITATSDLRFRDGLVWLLSSPLYAAMALGVGIFLAGTEAGPVYFVFVGVVVLVCLLCPALGRGVLTATRHVPRSGLRSACQKLVQAEILTGSKGVYRFRHGEISRKLGEETLDELARIDKLGMLSSSHAVSEFVDSRINPTALERADRLTAGLFSTAPNDQLAVTNRVLYLYFGVLRPQDALPVLSSFLRRRNLHSTARVHLAELLDALGRRDEASPVWSEVLAAHPEASWILNKWVRRQSLLGDQAAALDLLRERTIGAPPTENAFPRLLLAELQGRFGDDRGVTAAIESLDRIRQAGDPYLAHRSTLELARLRAELFDDCEHAEGLLYSLPGEGEIDGLKYARFAQLRHVAGDRSEAEQFGREASSLLCWDEDPTFQLEILLTVARVCEDLAPAARRRAEAMARFGWSLPGRDSGQLSGSPFDGLLLGCLTVDVGSIQG